MPTKRISYYPLEDMISFSDDFLKEPPVPRQYFLNNFHHHLQAVVAKFKFLTD